MFTKAQFIEALKDELPEIFATKAAAEKAFDTFCAIIATKLNDGERLRLPGVGSFTVSERAARTGRNPQTGAAIKIPARKVVKFSVSKGLKGEL
ncbi:HU family DNA-binding protein [Desulfocurvus sp.]|jgi:DNA-binding protein HU-beta|uniref:HU family DNA-binding protein n=1 Tax=Desulfocurvus sp. TaxID=2871698 RepID=UPI0025B8506F|nr:HU family DNA-binding protein [Desulfocurvus sp.]MCK9239436.1 HU family DNA-binding protein [Desulfocurvus sp.]